MKWTPKMLREFGITDIKIKMIDAIIQMSKNLGGKLTTEDLIDFKKEFISYDKKQEALENLEK